MMQPAVPPMVGQASLAPLRLTWLMRLPYPVRNVLRRWRGLLGMIVGVGIALGVGMTLLAVSRAAVELFTADFRASGVDLYVVQRGGTLVPILPSDSAGSLRHGHNLLAQIRGLAGVNAALGVMSWPMEREREGPKRPDQPKELVATMGVDGDPSLIPNVLDLKEGRYPRRSDEVMLGWKLAREKSLRVGDSLQLSGRDYMVVGIGKLRGFSGSANSLAYVEYRSLAQRAEVGDQFNVIAIDTSDPEATRRQVGELDVLSTFDGEQLVKQVEGVMATAVAMYWIFNVLTLTIAGLFVSNMLGRSVAARRLQFATLRAIGMPTRTILLTVSAEALLVSLLANLIGVAVSLGLGALLNGYLAPAYGFDALYVTDAGLFSKVFALSLGLGILAGLFPARKATRVDPVDVLREA